MSSITLDPVLRPELYNRRYEYQIAAQDMRDYHNARWMRGAGQDVWRMYRNGVMGLQILDAKGRVAWLRGVDCCDRIPSDDWYRLPDGRVTVADAFEVWLYLQHTSLRLSIEANIDYTPALVRVDHKVRFVCPLEEWDTITLDTEKHIKRLMETLEPLSRSKVIQ